MFDDGTNMYTYAGNDSVNYIDFSGLRRTFLDNNPQLRTDAVVRSGYETGVTAFGRFGTYLGFVSAALASRGLATLAAPIGTAAIIFGAAGEALGLLVPERDADNDNDGIPDVADADDDNDGIPDAADPDVLIPCQIGDECQTQGPQTCGG